jgi:hypothetical protein
VFYVKNNKHFIISRQYYFSTLGVIEQEVREEIRRIKFLPEFQESNLHPFE